MVLVSHCQVLTMPRRGMPHKSIGWVGTVPHWARLGWHTAVLSQTYQEGHSCRTLLLEWESSLWQFYVIQTHRASSLRTAIAIKQKAQHLLINAITAILLDSSRQW